VSQHRLVVGVFTSETQLLRATRLARTSGLSIQDAYTPYPVHGMDEAMGLPPSRLPRLCFLFGVTGLLLTLSFQYWVSVFDWPMNIGGKSYDASPALIPIAFELTVLFAGLGSVASFLRMRRLHPGRKPALAGLGALDDRFLLALREGPEGQGTQALTRFLQEEGALEIRELGAAS